MLLGIILAGGNSSRMQKDKGLLIVNGHSQIERTKHILLALGCDNVFISRNTPLDKEKCIADIFPDKGPLSGIHACLEQLSSEPNAKAYTEAIVVPVDMPLLGLSPLQQLLFLGRSLTIENKEQSAYLDKHYLPCYLTINDSTKQQIESHLIHNKLSLKELHQTLNAQTCRCHLPEQLFNTNTPEQWQEALEALK